MAGIISDNPEATSGRANQSQTTLSYPLNEVVSAQTRLRFVEYNRFNPSDNANETTTAVINLPLPITIPENYSFDVGPYQMGVAGNINNSNWDKIKNMDSSTDWSNMEDLTKFGQAAATDAIRSRQFSVGRALGGLIAAVGSSDLSSTVQSFTGVIKNPHTTLLFNGVNLRPISLEWRLSPRSLQESQLLKRIYDTIKLRAHPEEAASGYALNYPDLVYIEFVGKIEEYMPKFHKAFVTNINLTPDSSGGMSLYKSGAPTGYTFQISATELSIVTRNTLQQQIDGTT